MKKFWAFLRDPKNLAVIAMIGWLIAPPLSAQTAKANGACSGAINAAAGAKIFSKIDCAAIDAKTKAAIKKLEAKGTQDTKIDLGQAQAIAALKGDEAGQEQRIKKLEETIAGFLINAQSPGASGADVKIAAAIERGDATTAATLIRAKAGRNIKQAAKLYLQEAEVLATKDVRLAIRAATDSANTDPTNFWTWSLLSRLHNAVGSLPQARQAAEAALQRAGSDWDRMVAEEALGDLPGEMPAAHRHYQARLAASQAVLAANPDDPSRQREVSISYNKLGVVAGALGDRAGERTAYAAGFAIAQRLAASDPGNAGWQRDLFVSHNNLGDIAKAQDDLAGARAAYGAGFAIAQRLAASDPGNARWQSDLSVSYSKLGDFAWVQSDHASARTAYGAALAIRERLAAADPGNAEWQYDLSESHNKLGDVARAQRDLAGARAAYAAGLVLFEPLVASNPGKQWRQRVLSRRYNKLGDIARAQGDLAGARTAYVASLVIAERLAASDPDDAEWQHDVFVHHDRVARIADASGDVAGAIREFEAGEAILVALIARVGDHPGYARDLAQVRREIARLRAK